MYVFLVKQASLDQMKLGLERCEKREKREMCSSENTGFSGVKISKDIVDKQAKVTTDICWKDDLILVRNLHVRWLKSDHVLAWF